MSESIDLAHFNALAKAYASCYASPNHITFTVEGLRNLVAASLPVPPPVRRRHVLDEDDMDTLRNTHGFTGDVEEMAREIEAVILAKLATPAEVQQGREALSDERANFQAWVKDQGCDTDGAWSAWQGRAALAYPPQAAPSFQQRVQPWMMACFGAAISANVIERNHRFLEESLELVQSTGCTRSEAHQLVDYVYGRPAGETHQEVGGVMVTLAALCLAHPGLDMHEAGEVELARIWTKVEKIRAKQAAKPAHSPLPESTPAQLPQGAAAQAGAVEVLSDAERYRFLRDAADGPGTTWASAYDALGEDRDPAEIDSIIDRARSLVSAIKTPGEQNG